MQVVFASPEHFDGRTSRLSRQQRRLEHIVGFRLAAEASAEQGDIDCHIGRFETELLRQLGARRAGALRRGPDLAFAVCDTETATGKTDFYRSPRLICNRIGVAVQCDPEITRL